MEMDISLTPGSILEMSRGDSRSQPVVQVLEIKKSPFESTAYQFRFVLVVSDSVYTLQAMLDDRFNDLVFTGKIRYGSVIQLTEYLSTFGEVYILSMQVFIQECKIIGDPIPVHFDYPSVIYDVLALVNAAIAHQPPPPAEENQVPPTRIITPISALKPGLEEWTIKARVTSKGGIKEHNFSTCVVRIFSFDLLDSDGGQIHVKCSGNALVHQFFPHIKPGKVYLLSQGNLKHVPKHCNYLQKEWQIILKPTSVLEKCEEEDSSIPQQQFYFTPICDVKDAEDKSFLDVIGIVTNVSPPAWVRCPNGGAERVKRTLVLKDGTGETVEILLWGGFCDDEGQVLQDMLAAGVLPVVLAVKAGVLLYDAVAGGKSVHMASYSQLFYNPDLREARTLRSWFHSGAKDSAAFSISGGEPSQEGQKKSISSSQLFITQGTPAEEDEWRIKFDCAVKNAVARCIPRDVSQRKKKERPISLLFTKTDVPEPRTTRRRLDSGAKNTAALSISRDPSQGVGPSAPAAGHVPNNVGPSAPAGKSRNPVRSSTTTEKSRNWFGIGQRRLLLLRSLGRQVKVSKRIR